MEAIGKGLSAAHSAFACPRIRNLTVRISRLCYEPLSRSRIGRHCKTIEPPVLIRICISTYMTNYRGSSRTSSFGITDKEEFRASHYNHHVNNFYAYAPHLEAASTRDTLVYSDTVRKKNNNNLQAAKGTALLSTRSPSSQVGRTHSFAAVAVDSFARQDDEGRYIPARALSSCVRLAKERTRIQHWR